MKNRILGSLFFLLINLGLLVGQQQTVFIETSNIALVNSIYGETNYSGTGEKEIIAKTSIDDGIPYSVRSFFDIDISSIPEGAIIHSAVLHLYGKSHINVEGEFTGYISIPKESWESGNLTWNNQPGLELEHYFGLDDVGAIEENIDVDLTAWIRNLIYFPNSYTDQGYCLRLTEESATNGYVFHSENSSLEAKKPEIEILYELPVDLEYSWKNLPILEDKEGEARIHITSGNPPYTYSWSNGTSTVSTERSVTSNTPDEFTLTVTDNINRSFTFKTSIGYDPEWKNDHPENYPVFKNVLEKRSGWGWTQAVRSNSILLNNQDGWIEYTADNLKYRMIGFADKNTFTAGYTQILAGLYLMENRNIMRLNSGGQLNIGTYNVNDVVRIEKVGTTLKYYLNGNLIHTQTLSSISGKDLVVSATMYKPNTRIAFLRTSFTKPIEINFYAEDVSKTSDNGEVFAFASGGTKPYTFNWSNGSNSDRIQGLAVGTYTLTITDANGLTASQSIVINADPNASKNWTSSKVYDLSGNFLGAQRSFSDYAGRAQQSQSYSRRALNSFASQPVYDYYLRPAISTLSAPTYSNKLNYKQAFMQASDGTAYNYQHFDVPNYTTSSSAISPGEVDDPIAVKNDVFGTLGWYYSDNNTEDLYQDLTAYPYSRMEYAKLDPTQVVRSSAPHAEFKMGSGHEVKTYRIPVSGELMYMYGYANDWKLGEDYIINEPTGGSGATGIGTLVNDYLKFDYRAYKEISYSPEGKESVAFYDLDGKLIATAMSGSDITGTNVYEMKMRSVITGPANGEYRFVDIHLPEGCQTTIDLQESKPSTANLAFDIYNLITGEKVKSNTTATTPVLAPGVYRIVDRYYDSPSQLQASNLPDIQIKYKLNYHHFSLNYFDKKGQLVATVDPNGYDQSYFPSADVSRQIQSMDFTMLSNGSGINSDYEFEQNNIKSFSKSITLPTTGQKQFTNITLFLSLDDYVLEFNDGNGNSAIGALYPESGATYEPLPETYTTDGTNTYFPARIGGSGTGVDDDWDNYVHCDGALFTSPTQNYTGCTGFTIPQYTAIGSGSGGTTWCVTCVPDPNYDPNSCNMPAPDFTEQYVMTYDIETYDGASHSNLTSVQLIATNDQGAWSFSVPPNQFRLSPSFPDAATAVIGLDLSETATQVRIVLSDVKKYVHQGNLSLCEWEVTESNDYHFDMLRLNAEIKTHTMGARPQHQINNRFQYNSVGEVISVESSDEGKVDYVYTLDGILRFSQSAQQKIDGKFAYTNYDKQIRPIEMGIVDESNTQNLKFQNYLGEIELAGADGVTHSSVLEDIENLRNIAGTSISASFLSDQTWIAYDIADPNFTTTTSLSYTQQNLRGRVSKTQNEHTTTWYSYLPDGRLDWMATKLENFAVKTIHYTYDKRIGAVETIVYQKDDANDYFEHKYEFSIAGDLKRAYTRKADNGSYVLEAEYYYNTFGQLERVEIANDLQGIDYTYNVLGMLKAINSPNLGAVSHKTFMDPGRDGLNGIESDIFGMSFDYFDGDYTRDGFKITTGTALNNYYDGQTAAIRWNTQSNMAAANEQLSYDFEYYKTGWLKSAFFTQVGPFGDNNISPTTTQGAMGQYSVSGLTYDKNGNIQSLNRKGEGINGMDNFTYRYHPQLPNRLTHLNDAETSPYSDDLDDQGVWSASNSANWNYIYNAEGNMTEDKQSQLKYFYNGYGLVEKIQKNHGSAYVDYVSFEYNDMGLRSRKISYDNGGLAQQYTWYVRDASGAEVAQYKQTVGQNANAPTYPILADARLGEYNRSSNTRIYEFMDHLGNVRATFGRDMAGDLLVYSYADYYPFGSPLPGRNQISSPQYEHGYQGQFTTKDEETGLDAFELRMWDSRLARWTSTDPYGQFHSPYLGMGNNPISGVDPDGGFWGTGSAFLDAGITMASGAVVGGAIGGIKSGGDMNTTLQWMGYGAGVGAGAYGASLVNWGAVGGSLLNAGKATGNFIVDNAAHFIGGGASLLDGFMQGRQKIDLANERYKYKTVLDVIKNRADYKGNLLENVFEMTDSKGTPLLKNGHRTAKYSFKINNVRINVTLKFDKVSQMSSRLKMRTETGLRGEKVGTIRLQSLRYSSGRYSDDGSYDLIKVNIPFFLNKNAANVWRKSAGYINGQNSYNEIFR